MNFEPNQDQATFFTFLDQMIRDYAEWNPSKDQRRFEWSATLDDALEEYQFYDAAGQESLGLVSAAAMVYELSRLPVVVECTASAMLRPRLGLETPRPLAVLRQRDAGTTRFLPVSRSAVLIESDAVFVSPVEQDQQQAVESIFAFPMGRFRTQGAWRRVDADPQRITDLWRVGIAAEISGALQAGLDTVLEHVKQRSQFGRPLGSFQAIQHRLAGCATMIQASRWLAMKAAHTRDPGDCAIAAGYSQFISTKVVFDLHQFMGAMGLTLEHPLHRWTYRVRLLRSELDGAEANFGLAAERLWRSVNDFSRNPILSAGRTLERSDV